MDISLEQIITIVVKEVISELSRRGIHIESEISKGTKNVQSRKKIRIELKEYKTPLLTENHILEMDSNIDEIEVPLKTLITPSAKDLVRNRKIKITKYQRS